MFRYLVFAGERYYPGGGWDDFKSSHDSLTDACRAASSACSTGFATEYAWAHVVDVELGIVVERVVGNR